MMGAGQQPPMTVLILRPGNAQWLGARQEQQDAFGFAGCDAQGTSLPEGVLVALADGMGGLRQGRAASQTAVRTLLASYAAQPPEIPVPEALARALEAANQAVYQLARETEGEGAVGTTLVAAAVRADALFWTSVGDSRLYLYRGADGSLTSCTEDHTLANDLWTQVATGELAPDALAAHSDRNVLTSFLGLAEIPRVERSRRPLALQPGDRLLLCTDGVHGVLSPEELGAPLAGPPQAAAEALIAALRARGLAHQDNATVALLACEAIAPGSPRTKTPRISVWRGWLGAVAVLLPLGLGAAWLAWHDRPTQPPEPSPAPRANAPAATPLAPSSAPGPEVP